MTRLTRDGTAKPVSRDQILRREQGRGNINSLCSADHEQVWQFDPVDPYSDDYTCILYLYIQQVLVHLYYMYHECNNIYVLPVHSCHNTISPAMPSSPVILTNEDPRIQ